MQGREPTELELSAYAFGLIFYWARFARIWPVHFFCLALGIATVPAAFWSSAHGATWLILPLQIMLLNAWIPIERFVFGFNPTAWTISVECFFYLIYPLLIFHWKTTWRRKLAGSALVMLALVLIGYVTAMPAATTPEQENAISTLASGTAAQAATIARIVE